MKLKTLVNKAKKEIKTEKEESAIAKVKNSLKCIADCKKTLKNLEKEHKKLLESDIDELELEDFEY